MQLYRWVASSSNPQQILHQFPSQNQHIRVHKHVEIVLFKRFTCLCGRLILWQRSGITCANPFTVSACSLDVHTNIPPYQSDAKGGEVRRNHYSMRLPFFTHPRTFPSPRSHCLVFTGANFGRTRLLPSFFFLQIYIEYRMH